MFRRVGLLGLIPPGVAVWWGNGNNSPALALHIEGTPGDEQAAPCRKQIFSPLAGVISPSWSSTRAVTWYHPVQEPRRAAHYTSPVVPESFHLVRPSTATTHAGTQLHHTMQSLGHREITAKYGEDHFSFQTVEFDNKIILNVMINGIVDTTLDIPLSAQTTINPLLQEEESLGVEPVVLLGDPRNIKIQVVASQIGKVVQLLKHPRNVILSIASRWFGCADETHDGDFEKLMFVMQHVKQLLA